MTQQDFEKMGEDLCRTLLISNNIYIPPELRHLYGSNEDSDPKKAPNISDLFSKELKEDKSLI